MTKIKILLVDDHLIFLEGVLHLLSKHEDFKIVAAHKNGIEALKTLQSESVDLLITDISMPDINGVELIKHAKELKPELKILVLSSFQQIQSLELIDGYLLKENGFEVLSDAIRTIVTDNKSYFYKSEDYKAVKDEKLKFKKKILSTREKEIVNLIAKQYTVDEIAKELFLSRNTIDSHKKRIFHKLNVKNIAGLIKKAIYLGYINS